MDSNILRKGDDATMTKIGCLIGLCLKADRTDACYCSQSPAALFNAFGFVQISNPFFRHNVANVLAIDHDGCDRHARLLANFNCIQSFDEGRLATFGKGFKGLNHQLAARERRVSTGLEVEASWQRTRLDRRLPSRPVKKMSGRARMYSSIPTSLPNE